MIWDFYEYLISTVQLCVVSLISDKSGNNTIHSNHRGRRFLPFDLHAARCSSVHVQKSLPFPVQASSEDSKPSRMLVLYILIYQSALTLRIR